MRRLLIAGVLAVALMLGVVAPASATTIRYKTKCIEYSQSIDCINIKYERDYTKPITRQLDLKAVWWNSSNYRYAKNPKWYQNNGSYKMTGWIRLKQWHSIFLPRLKVGRGATLCYSPSNTIGKDSNAPRKCISSGKLY